jgi:hypothetical protein
MTGRGPLLLRAQRSGRPLDGPPDWLTPAAVQAWHDVIAAQPADVFRDEDASTLGHLSEALALWHAGRLTGDWTRALYRWLGTLLIPMANRRALLFPTARPSRSRRV